MACRRVVFSKEASDFRSALRKPKKEMKRTTVLCTLISFSPSSSPCPLVVAGVVGVVAARTVGVVAIVGGDGAPGGWASSSL
jgi:hypothetical protein